MIYMALSFLACFPDEYLKSKDWVGLGKKIGNCWSNVEIRLVELARLISYK